MASAEYADRRPAHLLGAIARVESGRPDPRTGRLAPRPWTINAEGTGAFFPTKAAGIAAVKQLQPRGVRSIDVGCVEINLMFHPNAFASLNKPFDTRGNALCAAQFLNELRAGTHDWLHAIADYHSQAPMLGKDYRSRVVALWHDPALSGWGLILATAYRISSQTAGFTLTSPGPARFMLRLQRPIPHRSTIDAPDATCSRRRRSDAEGLALAVTPAPRAFVARGKKPA